MFIYADFKVYYQMLLNVSINKCIDLLKKLYKLIEIAGTYIKLSINKTYKSFINIF